jgi:NAD(P)-dependent dehydrogenase (short-subunit alcohol dehydrogenase family)
LAHRGARVILAVRNATKGQQAKEMIDREFPAAQVELMSLDLADLSSIRGFADTFSARGEALDLLINNAGVMSPKYSKTKDGFEMQFGTNHLGHFALTGLLLPSLLRAPAARVVNVSSSAHKIGQVHFDNLDGVKKYNRWRFYGQSKLANLLFTYELQRRLSAAGLPVLSMACHPGFAKTNLMTSFGSQSRLSPTTFATNIVSSLFAQSVEMGALPTLFAAVAPTVVGGDFVGPLGGMRGYPGIVSSNARSYDVDVAKQLWDISEQLTGVHYNLEVVV